jgi:small subunit ribosomal protein S21
MNFNFEVKLRDGQHIDQALKLLKSKLENDGTFDVIRSKRSFETPAQKKKRKLKAAHKKAKQARLRRE